MPASSLKNMKNNTKSNRRVVITGLGPLTSIGSGKDALWNSIVQKRTKLSREKIFIDDELWDDFILHKVTDFNIDKFGIETKVLKDILSWKGQTEDRVLNYLLASVKLALDDSKISYNKEDNNIGLFLTVEHPGFEPFCEGLIKETLGYIKKNLPKKGNISKKLIIKHLYDAFVQNGYDLQTFMYLFLIAKSFGIHGYSLFTSNACASGLFAIESAARQIKYGGSSTTIVAGGDNPCTMFKHLWFKERKLYAEDGKIKPFAKNADGIVFGDGASAIVLEELGHALKRNANIYAEYLGAGFSLEGWKVTLPQIGSFSYQKAIKQALENSGLNPGDIDLINPHGVGIKVTDAYEAKAITDIFGKKTAVAAFKPYVGHNLGGSAVIETIILLLSIQKKIVPATLNCNQIEKNYPLSLNIESLSKPLDTTMKLSCGFSGYNAAAIFKKYE